MAKRLPLEGNPIAELKHSDYMNSWEGLSIDADLSVQSLIRYAQCEPEDVKTIPIESIIKIYKNLGIDLINYHTKGAMFLGEKK